MYFYLNGIVTLQLKKSIVVECNNVGYEVFVSNPKDFKLFVPQKIYTAFYVREDEQYLVGFKDFAEKEIFTQLISVKGVGPKIAITIIGGTTIETLKNAIDSSNVNFLRSLPGVGPKVASQIILDLRGKLTYNNTSNFGSKEMDDAAAGLKHMGFNQSEILSCLNKIDPSNLTTEQIIFKALNMLNKK